MSWKGRNCCGCGVETVAPQLLDAKSGQEFRRPWVGSFAGGHDHDMHPNISKLLVFEEPALLVFPLVGIQLLCLHCYGLATANIYIR